MLQNITATAEAAASPVSRQDGYRQALAHSARVRRLKVLLPLGAGLISAGFILAAVFRAFVPEGLSVDSARIENGKVVMERPAISGRNDDGISYSMTASRALQDIANPNLITLEAVKAAVPINDSVIARVTATGAAFNRGTDILDLDAPFDVNLSNGITARFKSAHLNIDAGIMDTPDPVDISMQEGSLVAQSLKIADKGRHITFTGQVRLRLDPAAIRNQGDQRPAP